MKEIIADEKIGSEERMDESSATVRRRAFAADRAYEREFTDLQRAHEAKELSKFCEIFSFGHYIRSQIFASTVASWPPRRFSTYGDYLSALASESRQ